jgi:hypothetical protein
MPAAGGIQQAPSLEHGASGSSWAGFWAKASKGCAVNKLGPKGVPIASGRMLRAECTWANLPKNIFASHCSPSAPKIGSVRPHQWATTEERNLHATSASINFSESRTAFAGSQPNAIESYLKLGQ